MKRVKDIEGRVAVVTGADGGIGYEYCKELAERGAHLVMVSINDMPLREAALRIEEKYGVRTYPVTIDLCNPTSTSGLLSYLDGKGLIPYILVNNAGIFAFDKSLDMSDRKVEAFIDLHVRSLTQLTRAFAARMAARGEGFILNMSSMSCWAPMPGLSMYAATKAYIRVFSRSLHYELRESGVRVMVACPGGIATDLFGLPDNLKKLALNLRAIERPETFVKKAINRLLKGKAQYINGLTNRLAIVFVGTTPRWMRMLIKHKMLDRGIHKK